MVLKRYYYNCCKVNNLKQIATNYFFDIRKKLRKFAILIDVI